MDYVKFLNIILQVRNEERLRKCMYVIKRSNGNK